MPTLPALNRIEKALLFLTAATIGLLLLQGISSEVTMGAAILGFASTWAVGHRCHIWSLPQLNVRHRLVTLIALSTAGVSMVLRMDLKFSLGELALGLALAYVVGSDDRVVHASLILIGASLAGWGAVSARAKYATAVTDYNQSVAAYRSGWRNFRSQLPQLAKLYPLSKSVLAEPPFSIVDPLPISMRAKSEAYAAFYNSGDYYDFKAHFDHDAWTAIPKKVRTELYEARAQPVPNQPSSIPQWVAEAMAARADVWDGPGRTAVEHLLNPELLTGPYGTPPRLSPFLEADWQKVLLGLLLATAGMVLAIWRPRHGWSTPEGMPRA